MLLTCVSNDIFSSKVTPSTFRVTENGTTTPPTAILEALLNHLCSVLNFLDEGVRSLPVIDLCYYFIKYHNEVIYAKFSRVVTNEDDIEVLQFGSFM